jgi:hypothetical protein
VTPAGPAGERGAPESPEEYARLVGIGRGLLARLGCPGEPRHSGLPDGPGVSVWSPVRGGGTVLVAPDGSALLVPSALGTERALEEFRRGRRTPPESFGRAGP